MPFKLRPYLLAALTFCLFAVGPAVRAFGFTAARDAVEPPQPSTPGQAAVQNQARRQIGTIKTIENNQIVLATDAGDLNVIVQEGAQIVRVEPGQKDLTGATALELKDLEVGDRVLVRGVPSGGGKSLTASAIIAMKHADVEAKQQQSRQEWQHGVGGLVVAVDRSGGIVRISRGSVGTTRNIDVHIAKDTVIRRYAPDSVRFDDAKPSSLEAIKPGDQLRARGTPSGNGSEFNAEEIVTGSFRNIAGPISSVNPSASTILIKDAITQRPVEVKVSDQSQIRKLPPEMAQGIAARLKATAGEPNSAPGGMKGDGGKANYPQVASGGRPPDLQQLLARIPAVNFADLQPGDEVMIVSTEPDGSGQVTAITLLAGVEPLLTASPGAAQTMMLSPWSLGGGEAGTDETTP